MAIAFRPKEGCQVQNGKVGSSVPGPIGAVGTAGRRVGKRGGRSDWFLLSCQPCAATGSSPVPVLAATPAAVLAAPSPTPTGSREPVVAPVGLLLSQTRLDRVIAAAVGVHPVVRGLGATGLAAVSSGGR